jgi:hypothetical protein
VDGIVLPRTVAQTVWATSATQQTNAISTRDALRSQIFQQLGALVPGRDVD